MTKWIYTVLAVALVIVVGVFAWAAMHNRAPSPSAGPTVTIGTTTFAVEVADTEAARELGLGGRDSLAAGHGMLFVFDQPGNWGFWMKDTRFALDMVWARQDGTVISVARDVEPSTYLEIFYPATPDAAYVLEVNAGAAAAVAPGMTMRIGGN